MLDDELLRLPSELALEKDELDELLLLLLLLPDEDDLLLPLLLLLLEEFKRFSIRLRECLEQLALLLLLLLAWSLWW